MTHLPRLKKGGLMMDRKNIKKITGIAAVSGAAIVAGICAGHSRRRKNGHGPCRAEDKGHGAAGQDGRQACMDEVSALSGIDVGEAAAGLLHNAEAAERYGLTEAETDCAQYLLSAYIGYLREEAPPCEQSLPMLMLLLANTEDGGADGRPDVIGQMIEDSAELLPLNGLDECRYYGDYRMYRLCTADKWPVIRACQKAVAEALADRCCCSMAG